MGRCCEENPERKRGRQPDIHSERRGGVGGRNIRRSGALLGRWLTSLLSYLGLPKESYERAPSFEVALVEGSNEVFKPSDLRFHKREFVS